MLERRTGQLDQSLAETEPEVSAFIDFLNQLFAALAVSLTRYAARVSRDKGSVSRYLNGRRIAPKDFVDELLRQVAEHTGSSVTDDVRVQAHQLRLEALRVRNASQHALEQLRDTLGAAERELHLANIRERALLRAVETAEERAQQAEQRYRQLEGDWAAAHYASGASQIGIYDRPDRADHVRDEIHGLKAELDALRIELSRAKTLKHEAEERCLRLEARLLAAEAALNTERTRAQKKAAAELEEARSESVVDPEMLHRILADLNSARSLVGTLQAVVEGAVHGLGFHAASVSLVRPDGDLVVAALWESEDDTSDGPTVQLGQVGSRESWERMLSVGDHWGTLRFLPHDRAWATANALPRRPVDLPPPVDTDDWHPQDILLAPMYSAGGDLLGALAVDRPRSGKRPGIPLRGALERFALQASIAVGNARLRAENQRALARLEKEQQALRASEESFRQAFEYAPNGMAITELHRDAMGQLTRVNDAFCRLLGRPRAILRQQRFADLVHPDDAGKLHGIINDGGSADVRLYLRDGSYQWVRLRNSVVADPDGPSFVLTVVEDIADWKREEIDTPDTGTSDQGPSQGSAAPNGRVWPLGRLWGTSGAQEGGKSR